MRIEAENLQLAYTKAAQELNCSVTELNIKIIQNPSRGIFGLFKKTAIIDATLQSSQSIEDGENDKKHHKNKKSQSPKHNTNQSKSHSTIETKHKSKREKKPKSEINDEILSTVREDLNALLKASGFNVYVENVEKQDDETIYIKIDGDDSALLIGKEGHRYKALSYMLYNWINIKFGLSIVLEISEFLQNQKRSLETYLVDFVEKAKQSKEHIATKPIDTTLVKFAISHLEAEFPNRHISVKNVKGDKILVVGEIS